MRIVSFKTNKQVSIPEVENPIFKKDDKIVKKMKIYKQNGDILELTVSEYKELYGNQQLTYNCPSVWFPNVPVEGYMSTSTSTKIKE